jgi:hypothetical protein
MNHSGPSRHEAADPVDPRVIAVVRYAIAIGAVLVLLLPAARGSHATLGWLPLWLLAMPLSAWWALHRFALPGWPQAPAGVLPRRRRTGVQARRRSRPARPLALPRAA